MGVGHLVLNRFRSILMGMGVSTVRVGVSKVKCIAGSSSRG